MLELIFEEEGQQGYMDFLHALYGIYHRNNHKWTKIARALILSCICGSVSRSQILLTGMYGDYRSRDIPNTDRLLSSNSETNPTNGRHYTQKFRRFDASGAAGDGNYPLYTATKGVGLAYLCTQCDEIYGQQEKQHIKYNTYRDAIIQYSRNMKTAPKNWHHTSYSKDILAIAFHCCKNVPFYLPELLVCNQYRKEYSNIKLVYEKQAMFRMDGFLALQTGNTPSYSCICYEQDTGSQRSGMINDKVSAYYGLMDTFKGQQECKEQQAFNGQQAHKKSDENNSSAKFNLLFGLACVYDDSSPVNAKTVAEASGKARKFRIFAELTAFSSQLLNIPDAPTYLKYLEDAYTRTGSRTFLDHIGTLQDLMCRYTGTDALSELCDNAIAPHISAVKNSQRINAARYIPAFLDRKRFLFQCFDQKKFQSLFRNGQRVCCIPNQLMDLYFPFLYPGETGLYDQYWKMLSYCGHTLRPAIEVLPPLRVHNINFPNACRMDTMEGQTLYIITENFSLDLSAQSRVRELFENRSDPGYEILLVFAYMEQELPDLRNFLHSLAHGSFVYSTIPSALSGEKDIPICTYLCCMEEFFENKVCSTLCEDGTLRYAYKLRTEQHTDGSMTFLQDYDTVPADAGTVNNSHVTLSLPVLQGR